MGLKACSIPPPPAGQYFLMIVLVVWSTLYDSKLHWFGGDLFVDFPCEEAWLLFQLATSSIAFLLFTYRSPVRQNNTGSMIEVYYT